MTTPLDPSDKSRSASPERPQICVGVVALMERLPLARLVLDDLTRQTQAPAQVVVVLQAVGPEEGAPVSVMLEREFPDLPLTVVANGRRAVNTGRNLVLAECRADVVLVMDDDARMPIDALERVAAAFEERPDAAVITFKTNFIGPGERPRPYPERERRRRTARSVTSVFAFEIAASLPTIKKLGVSFDERFGPGARFGNGEEFIFLTDVLRAGGEVWFVPSEIAEHPALNTGSSMGRENVEVRGAMLRRSFGALGLPVGALFVARKALTGQLHCSIPTALRAIVDGWREYGRAPGASVQNSAV